MPSAISNQPLTRLQDPDSGALEVGLRHAARRWRGPRTFQASGAVAVPLAARLVAVHAAVGRRKQRLVGVAVVREHRRADADCHRQQLAWPRLELQIVDGALQLEPLALGLFAAAARQDDDELLAGVADADVVRPDA